MFGIDVSSGGVFQATTDFFGEVFSLLARHGRTYKMKPLTTAVGLSGRPKKQTQMLIVLLASGLECSAGKFV